MKLINPRQTGDLSQRPSQRVEVAILDGILQVDFAGPLDPDGARAANVAITPLLDVFDKQSSPWAAVLTVSVEATASIDGLHECIRLMNFPSMALCMGLAVVVPGAQPNIEQVAEVLQTNRDVFGNITVALFDRSVPALLWATEQRDSAAESGAVKSDGLAEHEDDAVEFVEEEIDTEGVRDFYLILIADDNPEVHHATRLVLKDVVIHQRKLVIIDAYSGRETLQMINRGLPFDLILLDMTMETPDAGMRVAKHIQSNSGYTNAPAIIMRTGQPGYFKDEVAFDNIWFDQSIIKSAVTKKLLTEILSKHLGQREDDGLRIL